MDNAPVDGFVSAAEVSKMESAIGKTTGLMSVPAPIPIAQASTIFTGLTTEQKELVKKWVAKDMRDIADLDGITDSLVEVTEYVERSDYAASNLGYDSSTLLVSPWGHQR